MSGMFTLGPTISVLVVNLKISKAWNRITFHRITFLVFIRHPKNKGMFP